jgi:hypothetical protein
VRRALHNLTDVPNIQVGFIISCGIASFAPRQSFQDESACKLDGRNQAAQKCGVAAIHHYLSTAQKRYPNISWELEEKSRDAINCCFGMAKLNLVVMMTQTHKRVLRSSAVC